MTTTESSLYPYGVELAASYHTGISMRLLAEAGRLLLQVRDLRPGDPLSPVGLRRFTPAQHPRPQVDLTGEFSTDTLLAQGWLFQHKASVAATEIEHIAVHGHQPLLHG